MSSEVKEVKQKRKGLFSKIFGGVLFGLAFLLVIMQFIGQMNAVKNNGIVTYGNYQTFVVATDSMEPTYKVETMVFVKEVDDFASLKESTTPEAKDGDTITFIRNHGVGYTLTGDKKIITHRIIEIQVVDGEYYFRTLGDNLNAATCPTGGCSVANADWVKENDIIGVVVGQSFLLGKASEAIKNPIIMIVVILVPLLVVFSSSLIDLFKQLKTSEGQENASTSVSSDDFEAIKEQEKLKLLIELEKERLKQEMLKGDKTDEKE